MALPSKAATSFGFLLLLFLGLPFLVGGSILFFREFVGWRTGHPLDGPLLLGIAIPLDLIILGGFLIYCAFLAVILVRKQRRLESENPDSPWLWRKDWVTGHVRSEHPRRLLGRWLLAGFLAITILPVACAMLPTLVGHKKLEATLLSGFAGISLYLLWRAIHLTIIRRSLGKTVFVVNTVPFSLGGEMAGQIHVNLHKRSETGIRLRLRCMRSVTTGSGDTNYTRDIPTWEVSRVVPSSELGKSALGISIPIRFKLPFDAPETANENSNDRTFWLLHAESDQSPIDYSDDFEIPVFRSPNSQSLNFPETSITPAEPLPSKAMNTDLSFKHESVLPRRVQSVTPEEAMYSDIPLIPTNLQATVHDQADGVQFDYPAAPNAMPAFGMFCATVLFGLVDYRLVQFNVSSIFLVGFGFCTLVCLWLFMHITLTSYRLVVTRDSLSFGALTLGIGTLRAVDASDIDSISPATSSTLGTPTYRILLTTRQGKIHTLADTIRNRQEARWVVYRIETILGLIPNTRVEITAPGGIRLSRRAQQK